MRSGVITICVHCSREYLYIPKQGHGKEQCNSCQVNRRRVARKIQCVAYKGGSCIHCGYNKCVEALGFHHRDSESKLFRISGNHSRSWKVTKTELDKCDLVCANCHAEIHANDGVYPLGLISR